jgi:CheY-like chemotaxis protein
MHQNSYQSLSRDRFKNNYNFSDITILVAEDDIYNQYFLREILNSTKARILMANNGKEALELLEENPDINIALFDIKMPVMDGLTLARIIRAKYQNFPMIAQTAHILPEDKHIAFDSGFNELVTKPINIERLFMLIKDLAV